MRPALIISAAACFSITTLMSSPAAAQVISARVTSIYSAVPAVWSGAVKSFAAQIAGGPQNALTLAPILSADFSNPALRAGLAPIVMRLEAQGLTPYTASFNDFSGAAHFAREKVREERYRLVSQVKAATPGQADLPEMTAKLAMLQGPLSIYLPKGDQGAVQTAYATAHALATDVQRAKIGALMKHIANGLEGMTLDEAISAQDGSVLAGPVDENSAARKHARLAKYDPSARPVH